MLDKMIRVENMITKLSLALGIKEEMLQLIKDAASLAMSDLATAVVTEFTSLAGIMARHYALRDGYSKEVVRYQCVHAHVLCNTNIYFYYLFLLLVPVHIPGR